MDYANLINTLKHKGYKAVLVKNREEALKKAIELLEDCETVGKGGSKTLQETGIWDYLLSCGKTVYSTTLAKSRGEDPKKAMKDAMFADAYICSANAITEAGDIVNIDGVGNRVGALIYGPDKLIMVVGRNKITKNYSTAIARIKQEACPKNAERNGHDLPCRLTGKCGNCEDPHRMCKITMRLEYPLPDKEYHIILVDEDLGF